MYKMKVAVLFGGCSEEHDVSIKSAMELAKNLNTEKYEVFYIGITKYGIWKMCEKPCMEWKNMQSIRPCYLRSEICMACSYKRMTGMISSA